MDGEEAAWKFRRAAGLHFSVPRFGVLHLQQSSLDGLVTFPTRIEKRVFFTNNSVVPCAEAKHASTPRVGFLQSLDTRLHGM